MARSSPLVSVVIPTYNRSRMVVRAVESVLRQTMEDFEVFVVDDHSEDDTEQQVKALRDPRVTYVQHGENRGGAAARNTGIDRARGKYVAFLDSDDEWLPKKLEKQLAVARAGADVVYTGRAVFGEQGQYVNSVHPRHRGDLRNALLVENCVGTASVVLARRACLQRVGGLDESLPSSQDLDLWIRLSRYYSFDYVDEEMVKLHKHGGKRITKDLQARIVGIKAMLEKHYDAIQNLGDDAVAEHYFKLGRKCLRGRATSQGVKYVAQAIRKHPYRAEYYVHLLAGLAGAPAYHALVGAKKAWDSLRGSSQMERRTRDTGRRTA